MNSVQICCGEFIRIILFVLNFIFWAAGGVILGLGIYVKVSLNDLKDLDVSHDTLNTAALFLIGLGCVVFVVGLLGCCGSLTQNRCMLLLYFTLVTLIFLGEIALAIAVYANKDAVTTQLREQFKDCMTNYNKQNETVCTDTIDTLQSVLQCCGEMKPADWRNFTDYSAKPPKSCCPQDEACEYTDAFSQGCYVMIDTFVNTKSKYIGFGVLGVAVIELIGMSLACYLRVHIIKRTTYEQPHAA